MPVIVERYGYRDGSPGAGRMRGGAGMTFRLKILGMDMQMTARGLERFVFRPFGLHGGRPGVLGRVVLNPGTEREREVGKIDVLNLDAGDVIQFEMPSGGGLGDPRERDPELVLADIRSGMISMEQANEQYGVVVNGGRVDAQRTASRRAGMKSEGPAVAYGAERLSYEARWNDNIASHLVSRMARYPSRLRPSLFAKAKSRLNKLDTISRADVEEAVGAVCGDLAVSEESVETKRETAFERLNQTIRKGYWL
jgi:N-methylhydantoinase B